MCIDVISFHNILSMNISQTKAMHLFPIALHKHKPAIDSWCFGAQPMSLELFHLERLSCTAII